MILIFSRSYFSVKFSVWGKWYKRKSSFVLKMSLKCNKRRYHVSDDKEAVGYPSALFSNPYESRKGIFIIRAKVVYKYSRVHVFFSSVAFILFISPIYFIIFPQTIFFQLFRLPWAQAFKFSYDVMSYLSWRSMILDWNKLVWIQIFLHWYFL